jgi:integrase
VTWKKIKEAGIVVKVSTKLSQPGRQLAESLLTKRRQSSDAGEKISALHTRRVTFSEIADDATAAAKAHNRGWRHDASRIAVLKEVFGGMPAEIEPAIFREWLDEQPWKPSSLNRMKTVLRSVYKLAIENGKAKSNPARAIKRRREENTKLRFLSRQEDVALRAEITKTCPWHLPEYLVALNTGLRPSEQYEMEWSNVDFLRKQVSILRSKTGDPRHIPMNSEVVSALRKVEERPVRGQRIFLSENGQALVGYKHWFLPALKAAKIDGVTWYTLRHTFASRLVMAGVNLRTVADLMGHKQVQMTMRYSHLAPGYRLGAVERLISPGADTDTNTDTKQDSVPGQQEQVVVLQ